MSEALRETSSQPIYSCYFFMCFQRSFHNCYIFGKLQHRLFNIASCLQLVSWNCNTNNFKKTLLLSTYFKTSDSKPLFRNPTTALLCPAQPTCQSSQRAQPISKPPVRIQPASQPAPAKPASQISMRRETRTSVYKSGHACQLSYLLVCI